MGNTLLFSLIVCTFVIPFWAARDRSAVRGLRRTVIAMLVVIAIYVMGIVFILPRIS